MDLIREKWADKNDDDCCWEADVDYLTTRDIIGNSLAETDPFVQFLLEPMQFDDDEERLHTARFLMGFPMNDDIRNGAASLGYREADATTSTSAATTTSNSKNKASSKKREKKNTDSSNNHTARAATPLTGCVLVRSYDPVKEKSKSSSIFSSVSSLMYSGLAYYRMSKHDDRSVPSLFTSRQKRPQMYHFISIAGAIQKKADAWHVQYGPPDVHWYITQVGGPDTQRVLERLVGIADEEGMAIFAGSSGDDQVTMYEELGFKVVAREEFVDPENSARKVVIGCLLRQPKTNKKKNNDK